MEKTSGIAPVERTIPLDWKSGFYINNFFEKN